MKDLLEFSIPWAWRIKMVKQAFRPLEHSIADIVDFCEWQEVAEDLFKAVRSSNKNNESGLEKDWVASRQTGRKLDLRQE